MMLDEKLKSYGKSNIYPFHMPGHKRRRVDDVDPYQIDITEIEGFDNLHSASGIIKEAEKRAAELYGAKRSFYLVNGSTCGLLAAICAAVGRRQRVLIARNCHKAVYHALSLWELSADYLYPEITESGIAGQITAKQVRKALSGGMHTTAGEAVTGSGQQAEGQACPYAAVVITSPTYDGVVSDIEAIAKIVHSYRIPLIVDEAHGAHFGLSPYFPASAVEKGADIVIQSLHKTLPSYTQTALLHLGSSLVPERSVEKYLDIFETSSPSYILMAGMEKCIRLLRREKTSLFAEYWEKLSRFYARTEALTCLRVVKPSDFTREEAYAFDPSKILIFTNGTKMTGKELYDRLLADYGLQMEMASKDYVLAMTSIMDTQEGFERLAEALMEIDEELGMCEGNEKIPGNNRADRNFSNGLNLIYKRQEQVYRISEAEAIASEEVSVSEAAGRVSADYIYLYPPGIPLLAPGERITEENVRDIISCRDSGLEVIGVNAVGKIETVS